MWKINAEHPQLVKTPVKLEILDKSEVRRQNKGKIYNFFPKTF